MPNLFHMNFSHHFADLGEPFSKLVAPLSVREPCLLLWNAALAEDLGVQNGPSEDPDGLAQVFGGNAVPGSAQPVAMAYAGHQFGHFVPQLGDGRAHLLGELVDQAGMVQDVQLKGSGPTPFSRGGDGRCAIGPAIREYLMSEALFAMGVPTSRCLAVVSTGEPVMREGPLPGAVVTRVASSHLRVGTLQYFAARGLTDALRTICDTAIQRHDPDLAGSDPSRILTLFERVMDRQIELVTEWMRVGFIHGVMNTDNTALSGQTIDFGPCAMMNAYDPATVFSSIDRHGRYAFGNQPRIAQWNMARMAECLIPLVDESTDAAIEKLNPILDAFGERFRGSYLSMMGRKVGLEAPDEDLTNDLLTIMQTHQLDYTNTFVALGNSLSGDGIGAVHPGLESWFDRWERRLTDQPGGKLAAQSLMRRTNPLVIPRNHQVETVLGETTQELDGASAERFLKVIRSPYAVLPETLPYQEPPVDGDAGYRTFCGT